MIRVHKHTSVTSQTLAWRSCKTIKCLKMKNHVFKTNSFSLWHRANIRLMGTSFRNNSCFFNSKENAVCNSLFFFSVYVCLVNVLHPAMLHNCMCV